MRKPLRPLITSIALATFLITGLSPQTASASALTLEHKYQEVFVSAGYATALGAAVGAALLSFKDEPTDNLRYVAIGASVGFFAGTIFGTYLVVAPSFAFNDAQDQDKPIGPTGFNTAQAKEYQLIVQPTISTSSWKVRGVETGMVLARF